MGNNSPINRKTIARSFLVVIAATWVIASTMIVGPTPSHADDCEDVKIDDCLSRTPGLDGAGGGGTFIMDAPSGNEQHHVYIGPSTAPGVEESIVIIPGRNADVMEYHTRGHQGKITHHLDFLEGDSSDPDDETLEIEN